MTAARALLLALLAATPAAAQGRTRRHHRPNARPPSGPVALRLLSVERASADDARLALPTMLPAVLRCLDAARGLDPASVAELRRVDVTLRLDLRGHATAVEFEPAPAARGLSACLGGALLTWRQAGVVRLRASVVFAMELRPA